MSTNQTELGASLVDVVKCHQTLAAVYANPYAGAKSDRPDLGTWHGNMAKAAEAAEKRIAELEAESSANHGEWSTLMADVQEYFADEKAERGKGRVRLVLTLLGELRHDRDSWQVASAENKFAEQKAITALEIAREWNAPRAAEYACNEQRLSTRIAELQAKVDALERDRARLHSALQKLVTRDESTAEEYSEQDWIEARRALSGVPLDAARQSKP